MSRTWILPLSLLALISGYSARAQAQLTVTVDPTQDVHPISDLIYGINYPSDAQLAAGITVARWGGNSTSRYNYQIDVTNTGSDYYFENIAGCWSAEANYCAQPPADPQANSGANAFLASAKQKQIIALFTIPTLGWVAKAPPVYAHPFVCGCPRTALPTQASFDPYDMNCGNGKDGAGAWLACPAPDTTSSSIDAAWTRTWVGALVQRFGPSNGQRIYALDNEPALWSSTHHDVHPARLGYDELWQKMRDHAAAIIAAHPTALISGPAEWGWPNYFCSDADDISHGCSASSPDRAAHGGTELLAWLLQQARAYEQAHGTRILHYLDLHYYPQGGNPPEITRSLWDPSYTDPSWINDKIRLLPRMHDWVNANYPGTKLAVSEYDFYHHDEAIGAVAYAEVLGLFAREGLDMATAWSAPAETEIGFAAYRLYRNYDGQGARFESTWAKTTVSGSGVEAFAAFGPNKMTVVLVNEQGSAANVSVHPGSFQAANIARLFALGTGSAIDRKPDVTLAGGAAQVSLAPTSIALLEISGVGPATPDAGLAIADAAASPSDAAAASDGALPSNPDAGPTASDAGSSGASDAGMTMAAGLSGKCGCSAASSAPPAAAIGLWLLFALALAQRRR